jgi:hypothetical protein
MRVNLLDGVHVLARHRTAVCSSRLYECNCKLFMLILLLEPILLNGIPRTKRISKTHSRTIHLIDGRVVSQEIADMFDRQILDIRVDAFNNVVMVYSESHESGTGRS